MSKIKIIFMGTPEFAVPILEALNEKYEVVLVISQPNRAKKKNVFIKTPVALKAEQLNLNLIQPDNINLEYEYLKNIEADLLITAAYGQYVSSKILKLYKNCLNVHASLLPKHRGGAPIQRCLINGDKITGVSIMQMVKKLDAGCVYAKEEYLIDEEDDNTSLFEKLSLIGKDLLMNNLEGIYNNTIIGIPQDDSLASYSANLSKEEEQIDFNKTALEIVNQVRGLSKEPGAYINFKDVKLKVLKAKVYDYKSTKPGLVIETKKRIIITASDKAVELLEVIMPGKKLMSAKDFSNGQKLFNINDEII